MPTKPPQQDDGLATLAALMQMSQMAQQNPQQDQQQRMALALMEMQQRAGERQAESAYRDKALATQEQRYKDSSAMDYAQLLASMGQQVDPMLLPEHIRGPLLAQRKKAFDGDVALAQQLAAGVYGGEAMKGMDAQTQLVTALANAKIRATPELLGAVDYSQMNPYPGYRKLEEQPVTSEATVEQLYAAKQGAATQRERWNAEAELRRRNFVPKKSGLAEPDYFFRSATLSNNCRIRNDRSFCSIVSIADSIPFP